MATALRSFANTITKREVSIAIERILIAPSSTTWTPTPGTWPTSDTSNVSDSTLNGWNKYYLHNVYFIFFIITLYSFILL